MVSMFVELGSGDGEGDAEDGIVVKHAGCDAHPPMQEQSDITMRNLSPVETPPSHPIDLILTAPNHHQAMR